MEKREAKGTVTLSKEQVAAVRKLIATSENLVDGLMDRSGDEIVDAYHLEVRRFYRALQVAKSAVKRSR